MGFQKITHRERVQSYADCAKLVRALGARDVFVGGWQASDPAAIEQLVAAPSARAPSFAIESRLHFYEGRFDDAVWTALAELAAAKNEYLDVETPSANLRIWPSQSKVHAAEQLDELVQGRAKARHGMPGRFPYMIETTDAVLAFETFRRLAGPTFEKGFVTKVADAARPVLARFIIAAGAKASASLVLDIDVAEALAAKIGGDALDWQGGGVHVHFPSGEITSTIGNEQAHTKRWSELEARVSDAFAKAKLRSR